MSEPDRRAFATRQLHAGLGIDDAHRSRTTPIYLTAGFEFDDFDHAEDGFGGEGGYTYTRVGNPTITAVERRIAALEGGTEAILLGSGQAAVAVALLALLQSGDRLLSASSLYEGSRSLFTDNFARLGIHTDFIDIGSEAGSSADVWDRAITPETRAVFVESISNPTNELIDLAVVAEVAHRRGIPLVVDNTFATPYLLRPIEFGADVVIHSASKFLAGHGSVLGGVIVDGGRFDWSDQALFPHLNTPTAAGDPSYVEAEGSGAFIAFARNGVALRLGPTASPLNAFLIQQGVETLSLRVERQSANALGLATWLEAHPEVQSVDYAGLPSSPHHPLALRYLPDGAGSVFAFTLEGGADAARVLVDTVETFTRMTHLGDVRSLILHPASTTHVTRTEEQRRASGVGPGLLRVSVGIEHLDDLIDDLDQALAQVAAARSRELIAAV